MPTLPASFDPLRMKIGRAETHLRAFDALVVEYCSAVNAYRGTFKVDEVNQQHSVFLTPALIKGDVVLTLADFVYALRSGLDQLCWNLSLLRTPTPPRATMFPIHADRSSKAEKSFRSKVSEVAPEAIAIIEELQPYQRGADYMSHPLWQLNELSNIDKHRLPTGRANLGTFDVQPKGFTLLEHDGATVLTWPLALKDKVVIGAKPANLTFGDPWGVESSERAPLELDRFQIAEIYRFVREDVAPRFERFFKDGR